MARVGRRRRETKVPIKGSRSLILGMNGKRANADDVRHLKRTPKCIEQQPRSQATPLCLGMNRKTGKHQQRNWMARHALDDALGGVGMANLAGDHRIKSDHLTVVQRNIGLRRIRLLRLQSVPYQEAIKLGLSAREILDRMAALQLLNAERASHGRLLASNTDGSLNKRSKRG